MEATHKHEFACDRCDASAWFYPECKVEIGLGCDCGGAWIDLQRMDEPDVDFPTLLVEP